jgi:hypothetical protein
VPIRPLGRFDYPAVERGHDLWALIEPCACIRVAMQALGKAAEPRGVVSVKVEAGLARYDDQARASARRTARHQLPTRIETLTELPWWLSMVRDLDRRSPEGNCMRLSRHVWGIPAILASLIGVNLLASPSAQAATTAISCSGTITANYPVSYPGDGVVGNLTVYYNSTNGGTNSACFHHVGKSYGVASLTFVQIHKCAETSGEGRSCTLRAADTDFGEYAYHAGPVGVTGTANACVMVEGYIYHRGAGLRPSGVGSTVGC